MTELILSLFFVLLFCVLPQDSGSGPYKGESVDSLKKRIIEKDTEISKLRTKIDLTEKNMSRVKAILFTLLKKLNIPLSNEDASVEKIENSVGFHIEQVQAIKNPGKSSGGTGKPNCLQSGGHVLAVTMYDDGYTFRRDWTDQDADRVNHTPKILDWIAAERVSIEQFKSDASELLKWSNQNECRYCVKVYDRTTTKKTYIYQYDNVDWVFYPKRMKSNP